MSAILKKTLADIRRRKVQTTVITLVLFLSSLAAIMALTLLVESDAPFDHAFQQAQGAHLTMSFSSSAVTEDALRATASTPGVTAVGGPWRIDPWAVDMGFGRTELHPLAGRDGPGGAVDRLTLSAGRWARTGTEVVISQRLADESGLGVGATVPASSDSPFPAMTVVGIASGVGDDLAAWTVPSGVPLLTTGKTSTMYEMVYRLAHASTAHDISTVANAISARLPQGAVVDSQNYLDAKLNADRTTAVMIPFLLAFSGFALLASALIIANLVGGAVIAGTRDIGIMKSLGYTPGQVVAVVAGQMLLPAVVGCLLGVPLGLIASQPFLSDTAHAFGLPRTFGVAPIPDALGVAVILGVVVVTTLLTSWQAGRMSAAVAIATGSAPPSGRGYRVARLAAGLRLPRALTLGAGESFARPLRSAMTALAIVIGVATITFSLGLTRSLSDVKAGLTRDKQVQVTLYHHGGPGKGSAVPASPTSTTAPTDLTDQQVSALIAAQPGTARFVPERENDVTVAGVAHPVPLTAYWGDSSWLGYPLINGRWFTSAGEAVAPTAFFTATGHHVGDHITADLNGQSVPLTLVGEIFDIQGDGVLLRTSHESLPGTPLPTLYEIQVRPGTDINRYAAALANPGSGLDARTNRENGTDTAFLLINSTLAGLALILTLIALAGVFNTVVLNIREKARDIAILKAVGMTPGQVVAMVLASVVLLGIVAAAVGIPAGMLLQHRILVVMGQIASSTNVPNQYFNVFDPILLTAIAGGGIVIAVLGSMVPAQWAARSRVTEVLQTE